MNGSNNFAPLNQRGAGAPQRATADATQRTPQQVLYANEQQRRHRLVRLVSLGIFAGSGLLIPTALIPTPDVVTLVAVLFAFVGAGIGYLLNRMRFVNSAGYAVLLGMMLAIGWEIVAQAIRQGGLDLNDLRVYDMFVLPIVLSAVLVTRRGPVILAVISIAFTIGSMLLLHQSPPLQQYWNGTYPYAIGSSYDVVVVAVVMQGLAATAAWLGADSVRRALLQAYRVDEIAAAKAQIEAQQQRLQRGIAHIQQVHAAVAHGQWDARAQVEAAELIPVAVSLNLLLDRLSRLTRDQEQRQRVDRTAHELAVALRRLRQGGGYAPPAYTGTPFDEVLMELDVLRTAQPGSGSGVQGNVPAWDDAAAIANGQNNAQLDENAPTWRLSGVPAPKSPMSQSPMSPPAPQSWPPMPESGQPPLPHWLRED